MKGILLAFAESKSLHGDISCVPNMVSEKLKQATTNSVLQLHETAKGKEMFTLFQGNRVISFNSSYLSGLEEIFRERARLMSKKAKWP